MFELVYKVLGNTARLSIQFAHIHGTGLCTATVNIYKKQAGSRYTLYISFRYT